MKNAINFVRHIIENRYLLFQLTKRNVTAQYKRSKLGMFWSLAEPLAFMGILYVVFGIGLRGGRNMDIPFICYLITGLAVIQFFSQTLSAGTNAIRSHAFLINKVHVRLSILPLVSVLSGIVDHIIFLTAVIVILLVHHIFPDIYWLQVLYYQIALSLFLVGLTLFTASVGVFFPDLQSIVRIVSRMLFYGSPIFWDFSMIPERLQFWLKLNPLFYIVMGYRNAFFYKVNFWEDPFLIGYFWSWTIFMILFGGFVFSRLKNQFADYL